MNLLQNPFYILQATPRDNRQRIMELADERSLLLDPETCSQARLALTTPKKRLAAEVAWLPGLGPTRAGEMLSLVETSPGELFATYNLPPVTRANLLAAGIARVFDGSAEDITPEDVTEWVIELAWEFEDIDPHNLRTLLNEERNIAGFPPVLNPQDIEAELQELRQYYSQVILAALNTLSSRELVEAVTLIADSATDNGWEPGPVIVSDLVDRYELEAQGFFEKEEQNISLLEKKLRDAADAKAPDAVLAPIVEQLISVVKNWDTVAQPIQVSMKGRGLDHAASHRIAHLVRELAVYLFNEHDKLAFSQQLIAMQQEVFAEVGKVADITAEDTETLNRIAKERIRQEKEKKRSAATQAEPNFCSITIGRGPFKKTLDFSPLGILWENRCWPLESITRVRWGTNNIAFGNASELVSIKIENGADYRRFVECLGQEVGSYLLAEYLAGLQAGKKYRFGSAVLSADGIELEHRTLLGQNEQVFCRWNELTIWKEDDLFCVRKTNDRHIAASFSYLKEDNIPILELIIKALIMREEGRWDNLFDKLNHG
ncbi:MAG: hypothetical protein NC211_07440 [Alistipes senegalensis]|nr:hypothetical protein [Oxalobacter formigenes]MCM1281643.1 hypothetical protein [Alistipes senegalensis]